jgi:hypothetical protein
MKTIFNGEGLNGIEIIKSPCELPKDWPGCLIVLKPDGTIDKEKSWVIKYASPVPPPPILE